MGAYLSKPVVEKHSSDESNNILTCAASSMQGWRITQEDAHNLILNFDKDTSLFAVYDGHGGAEVAKYCAEKLPDSIKETQAYKNGDIAQGLKDAFLSFDATIAEKKVIEILKNYTNFDNDINKQVSLNGTEDDGYLDDTSESCEDKVSISKNCTTELKPEVENNEKLQEKENKTDDKSTDNATELNASSNESEEDDDEDCEEYLDESSDSCEDDIPDPKDTEFMANMKEEPGSDSGTTAVVAIIHEKELYVANAGDSRCVLCRNGKAVDMSIDHKPEDESEQSRITKAGGRVTLDGRVNGGLNLSRAIGDHAYKQNKNLPAAEQMITALPDVQHITLTNEDEFIILACDGIWNYLNSQETVDFVRSRYRDELKLSCVIEQLFDHCLAPNTMGDGTGCDNMTAIIISLQQLHGDNKKLPEKIKNDSDDALSSKRAGSPQTTETR
ncbi:LOW QUALITY PROTEIN: probable protein phosphatase CG10417 [Ctenocephalides felis]|uniref:LOW QUALITY PROTEIN: probable protein phosphatase CG10417 n=1 Tax=Ctenocephalides felis TaxID=7515 RepID=UPI000E6E5858|nr:LOW QUALITY PROTEIN: probable protein phosphatase CG10417 [Ctenocephalides felis]